MAKILVVDDDPAIVTLLRLRLGEAGHEIVASFDGASATAAAMREKPDLIILDFNMPAADGAKVHERIRGNESYGSMIPVIFLTATPVAEIITKIKSDEKTRFMEKPIDFSFLGKMVAALLGASEASPAPAPAFSAPADPFSPAPAPDEPSPFGGDVLDLDS